MEAKKQGKKKTPVKRGKNIAPVKENSETINQNPFGIGNPPPTKPFPPKK